MSWEDYMRVQRAVSRVGACANRVGVEASVDNVRDAYGAMGELDEAVRALYAALDGAERGTDR